MFNIILYLHTGTSEKLNVMIGTNALGTHYK